MIFQPQSSTVTINGNQYQLVAFYFPGSNTTWDNYYKAPFCGNFWQKPLALTINNIQASFHTAEAAFQCTKWWADTSIRQKFENALTGNDAFHIKKHLHNPDRGYAGLGRDGAMMAVVTAKFQDPDLQAGLLATNDAYLLEHNSVKGRDKHWSDDHDGTGLNMLGISLMKVRQSLGGSGNPYSGPVIDMTNNVQKSNTSYVVPQASKLKIIPSVYSGGGKEGDFEWMIQQKKYAKSFFIFNDNVSQFEARRDNPNDQNGCSIGGGNAVIRPYQCNTPPQAGGIPTGPQFSGLTDDAKKLIDEAIVLIKKGIKQGGYDGVVFSSNGHGGLGTSIFSVPAEVKKYVVQEIYKL